ncbi:group III truncated hemoglobin [Polycladidibacter hongkongensis]|uniref:group III truncated hemoglobin n=1 Tax=Polycladidibacter hongkongensis TaxID=1647556 RepID=UPI000A8BFEC9|nr:group III truncated hemoglobin [Pseudovibrio hongkongensis]
MSETIPVLPAGARTPLDETITPQQINELVECFYAKVRAHPSLGPVFAETIQDDWRPHLQKMKHFWASVLLKTGTYKGKPVPAHAKLQALAPEHFDEWMDLFATEVERIFAPSARPKVMAVAQRIAQSLWLAKFASPFDNPPTEFGSTSHSQS